MEAAQPPVAPAPTIVHEAPPAAAPPLPPPEPATAPPAEATPAPVVAAPAPGPAETPLPDVYTGPPDNDPPTLEHTPVASAPRGRPLVITAHATDPSGIFGPVLYVRKKGLNNTGFIPLRMTATRGKPGDYQVELAPALTSVEGIEYYVEVYDNAGNGPVRAGSPEAPLSIVLEQEKQAPAVAPVVRPNGAPPAITHTAVMQATKNTAIENQRAARRRHRRVFAHGDVPPRRREGLQGAADGQHRRRRLHRDRPGADGDERHRVLRRGVRQVSERPGPQRRSQRSVHHQGVGPAPAVAARAPEPPPGPRTVKAPFRANPGRALGWLAMAGFVGGAVFAGGEALAANNAHSTYEHTFAFEGRDDRAMLAKANADGNRAKTALLVAGPALVVGIVLLIVFPDHPDTMVVGGSGDVGVKF